MENQELKNSMPDLHSATVIDNELFEAAAIDYTRGLDEYPTAQTIIEYLHGKPKPKHIYTKDLNVGGIAVADSMEKYLEDDSLGSSKLKAVLKTPMHYEFSKGDDKTKLEKLEAEKNHFQLGNYCHEAMLEPTKFSRALVEPTYSLSTKDGVKIGIDFWSDVIKASEVGYNEAGEEFPSKLIFQMIDFEMEESGLDINLQPGKKFYLSLLIKYSGKVAVTAANFEKIQILKKHYELYGGGIIKHLLTHAKREISLYVEDAGSGQKLKVRPDALQFKENIGVDAIVSIKSTGVEDLRAFYNHNAKFAYDLSEGMYQEVASRVTGRDFNCTIMIMLQTIAPFAVAVLIWNPHDIEMGKYKFRTALESIVQCEEAQLFPGYDAFAEEGNFGLINMELPQWNNRALLPTDLNN